MDFKKSIEKLRDALELVNSKGIDLNDSRQTEIYDYKSQKDEYYKKNFLVALNNAKIQCQKLPQTKQIHALCSTLESKDISLLMQAVNELSKIEPPKEEFKITYPKKIPLEIRQEMLDDLKELQRCFNADCLRSSVILCGRLLETALFRKYYEVTKFDILEKNPGMGLGTLIAKLTEKNIKLDPGLTQQIHLINQVRIFSVHTKKQSFNPSKAQAQAMILYTVDILDKLF